MAEDYSAQHNAIVARYDGLGSAFYDAALKFSLLVVTNLMLINAGGLLAIANGVFGKGADAGSSMLLPACFFVAGLLFALACGYVAYLNFGFLGSQQREFQTIEIWQVAKRRIASEAAVRGVAEDVPGFMSDGRSFAEFVRDSDGVIAESQKRTKARNAGVSLTFILGQVTGILSAASFVAACIIMVMTLTGSQLPGTLTS